MIELPSEPMVWIVGLILGWPLLQNLLAPKSGRICEGDLVAVSELEVHKAIQAFYKGLG